jgi:predicted SAM-dependent methyltransferase
MAWDKIILGCGEKDYGEDALHIDIRNTKSVDIIFDLNVVPWPITDGATKLVVAEDIIEHLDDIIKTMEEIHRILKPKGIVKIVTPHKAHLNSWHDPTHKWHLTERSFDYFDPKTIFGKKYSFYTSKKFSIEKITVLDGNINLEMHKLSEASWT